MASDSDVVRLTHQQLVNLAKQRKGNEQNDASLVQEFGKKQGSKARRKRPDQVLYHPRNLRKGDFSEDDEDTASNSAQASSLNSTETSAPQYTELEMDNSVKNKRRQKRPDLQIYSPKYKNQDEFKMSSDGTVKECPPQVESACDSQRSDSSLTSPSHGQRKVDIKSGTASVMVTVVNEGPPPPTFNNRSERAVSAPPGDVQPKQNYSSASGGKRNGRRGSRQQKSQTISEHNQRATPDVNFKSQRSGSLKKEDRLPQRQGAVNTSKAGNNSLEWDYHDEMHCNYRSVDEGVTGPSLPGDTLELDYEQELGGSHAEFPSDGNRGRKKTQPRNRQRGKDRNKPPPGRESSRERSSQSQKDQADNGSRDRSGPAKRNRSNSRTRTRPLSAPKATPKNENAVNTTNHPQNIGKVEDGNNMEEQISQGMFQGLVITNSRLEKKITTSNSLQNVKADDCRISKKDNEQENVPREGEGILNWGDCMDEISQAETYNEAEESVSKDTSRKSQMKVTLKPTNGQTKDAGSVNEERGSVKGDHRALHSGVPINYTQDSRPYNDGVHGPEHRSGSQDVRLAQGQGSPGHGNQRHGSHRNQGHANQASTSHGYERQSHARSSQGSRDQGPRSYDSSRSAHGERGQGHEEFGASERNHQRVGNMSRELTSAQNSSRAGNMSRDQTSAQNSLRSGNMCHDQTSAQNSSRGGSMSRDQTSAQNSSRGGSMSRDQTSAQNSSRGGNMSRDQTSTQSSSRGGNMSRDQISAQNSSRGGNMSRDQTSAQNSSRGGNMSRDQTSVQNSLRGGNMSRDQTSAQNSSKGGNMSRDQTSAQNSSRGHSPRGGGIIRLPMGGASFDHKDSHSGQANLPPRLQQQAQRHDRDHGRHDRDQGRHDRDHQRHDRDRDQVRHDRDQARSRGRGGSSARGGLHRTLFDPKNPTKPIQIAKQTQSLQFQDPSDLSPSPGSPGGWDPYGYPSPPQFGGVAPVYNMGYSEEMSRPTTQHEDYYNYMMQQQYYNPAMRDPYYHNYEEANSGSPGGRGNSMNKTKAESLLREVLPLDSQLSNIVSHGLHGKEGLHKILGLRQDVQNKYEQIILLDPDTANKHNIEQSLWKCAFYQIIELLRKQMVDAQGTEWLKAALVTLLDEGTTFYESLLKSLQTSFGFQLDDFLDSNHLPPDTINRVTKLGLLSAQRSMIALGDIARYREQTLQTSNFGRARNFYMKSQQIAPKNGRPYNQLAILALYTRRKLDAVYYYMRSLAASNPFLTARESLMSLFDEARKKAEHTDHKRAQEQAWQKRQQQRRRHSSSEHSQRVEIWISPDGSTCQDEINDDDDDELRKLSAVELNKRFVLSFLNVHGKLFTKIGMETFPEVSSQMLHEFQVLLQHSPSPIGNNRLLQLVTVNMFAIENTAISSAHMEEDCRSLVQEQAVALGLDMFGLLVERSTQLFTDYITTNDCQIMSEDLHQLFPSVKVWADWLICHASLWNPPPLPRDPQLGPTVDVWTAIAEMCNVLGEVDISHVKIYPQKKEGCDPIVLGEDTMLAGFVPLLSLPQIPMYVHSITDKEIARDCLRVEKMRTFGDYLCGIEPPMLHYDVGAHRYQSVAPEFEGKEEHFTHDHSFDTISSRDEDDAIIEDEVGSDEDHIRHLRAKKEELEKQVAMHQHHHDNIQAVLDSSHHKKRIEMEVCALFLVPDTNCFIDHLIGIQKLLGSKRYTLVLPLVVINELDGLAKGGRLGNYESSDHANMVRNEARSAVEFIEEQFESRNSHIRALTSKGSVLDTIAYRAEETDIEGNNDDLILSCCLHYCQDKARNFMPKDKNKEGAIRLYREVVLLTEDRNLRLKAHLRNVPVKDIPAFMHWAKIS